jgi:hypothetical protein
MTDEREPRSWPLESDAVRLRVRVSRAILAVGTIVQLLLIAALPFDAWKSHERYALLTLAAMVVSSVGISVTLIRYPRGSVRILSVIALLAAWQLIRFAHGAMGALAQIDRSASSAVTASFLIASLAYITFIVAWFVAWPMRKLARSYNVPTAPIP